MPSLSESYPTILASLADHYGQPRSTVEPSSHFEAVVAAGLNLQTALARCNSLLEALAQSGLDAPNALAGADPAEVRDALREAGITLSVAGASLMKRLARWYVDAFAGDETLAESSRPTSRLRRELAAIRGLGPGTVDQILLALSRPVYPVDRATYRILVRHGWIDCSADYHEVSELLSRLAGYDCQTIAQLSGWLARVGRQFCGPTSPRCAQCPLLCLLPDGGPRESET
jgi:endonuclease-3 related protein